MSEPGGPTTQSGIFYQNSVSALFLGRLCDAAARPDDEWVDAVRVEAPTEVDDTVVTFADGHRTFIQAKETVRSNQQPWRKLWKDFDEQFGDEGFRRGEDRLFLCVGEGRDEHFQLKSLCERAAHSAEYDEWLQRLNGRQQTIVRRIESLRSKSSDSADTLDFFSHIDVEIWPLGQIERDMAPYWVPDSNRPKRSLFSLLRDRVGGEARRRGQFTAVKLRKSLQTVDRVVLSSPSDVADLRESVRACGSVLKQHKHTFGNTGRRLERGVVDDIVGWLQEADSENAESNVAMLLDGAGMGKTVMMHDVVRELEAAGATVLAIKADAQLSGVVDRQSLQERLDLPDRIDRVVRRLASDEGLVVLLDQIDALSLSMARDQRTLALVLETVAKLRDIPNVRVLFSCRAFDLSNDPRLERVEVARRFALPPLSDDEIRSVLDSQGIDLEDLSPATKDLLRVPLHLDLFSRLLATLAQPADAGGDDAFGISTLQDLYALLWRDVVLANIPDSPPASERQEALRLLTDHMNRAQRTSAPRSVFARPETEHLRAAADWLSSEGILVPNANDWSFLHQTFFDYCYARHFVEEGGRLPEAVLEGDQGLSERPRIVHVLSYLRGNGDRAYLGDLQRLLRAENLRVHLKLLVLGWFGSLHTPTDDEWFLAQRIIANSALRKRLLMAMGGNPGWFARMKEGQLQELFSEEDEVIDSEVVPYLISMIDVEQAAVVELIQPLAERDGLWEKRVRWMLARIRDWNTLEAVRLFESMLQRTPVSELGRVHELHDVAKAFPRETCSLIRLILDKTLEGLAPRSTEYEFYSPYSQKRNSISNYVFDEAVKAASEAEPHVFVEQVLPWVERVVGFTEEREEDWPYFARDRLAYGWYGAESEDNKESLMRALVSALSALSYAEPDEFRRVAERLADLPYQTPQQLLAHAYRAVPELYAGDALHFLVGDARRLELGDREQYDTRQLIKAIYPFLSADQRVALETIILSYNAVCIHLGLHGLKLRGLEQLYLLHEIPAEHLTERGAKRLAELERKFPGVRASEDPLRQSGIAWTENSPITEEAIANMSDEAWLRAMGKYKGKVRHKDWHRGGSGQLGSVLSKQAKENPERFYPLALQAPTDLDFPYVRAFIDGLSESDAPGEWVFDLIARFSARRDGDITRTIAWALEKRAEGGLSDEMLDLLEDAVRGPMGKYEVEKEPGGQGPHGVYINSDRGSSLKTLMGALRARETAEAKNRMWTLLEFASIDPSTALRSGAIEELLYLLHEDRGRAISLFEAAMDGHPELLCSWPVPDFLRYGSYQYFLRMRPFIEAMLENADEDCQQGGAVVACVAAISPASILGSDADLLYARELAERSTSGPSALRRGAARVYAHNLNGEQSAYCAGKLARLLDDKDDKVRDFVANAFRHTRGTRSPGLREFVEDFAGSRALHAGSHEFSKYLLHYGLEDPEWSLLVLKTILDNPYDEDPYSPGGEKLVRLVLRLYIDPTADETLRTRTMDVFDVLMERYTFEAQRALEEWDRS